MVLVIIMVVAWVVVLGPGLLRHRSRSLDGVASISHFHRQLRILQHSAPEPIVPPAYRLHAVGGALASGTVTLPAGPEGRPVLTVVRTRDVPRPALAFLGEDPPGPPAHLPVVANAPAVEWDGHGPGDAPAPPAHPSPAALHARAVARRRRRDTLGVLVALFLLSLVAAAVAGAAPAWAASAVTGAALVAYVLLLVRLRVEATEHDRKLHYLDPVTTPALGTGPARPGTRVSGRYAHPSSQAVAAR